MIKHLIDRYFIKQPRLRRTVTRLLYGKRDCAVNLFGVVLTINSLRENGYKRAAGKIADSSLLSHEVGVLLSLSTLLRPGDTFLDVGANVGLFCCTLSRINRVPSEAQVRFYAYEPHPDTFKRLRINAARCGVIARNVAVSDSERELQFVDGAVSHVFTTVDKSSAYNLKDKLFWVRTVRLDEEPIEGNSIVLKIDVENQELAVLKGAEKLFAAGRVKVVYLDGYSDHEEVEGFLRRFGFRFFDGRSLEPLTGGTFSLLAVR